MVLIPDHVSVVTTSVHVYGIGTENSYRYFANPTSTLHEAQAEMQVGPISAQRRYCRLDVGLKWTEFALLFEKYYTRNIVFWKRYVNELQSLSLRAHLFMNRMARQWAESLVEIMGTLADIRGTNK